MRFIRTICCCLLFVILSGCAAIGSRKKDGAGRPFMGVRNDAHYLVHPSDADYPALQPLNIIDMPFSFGVDCVCCRMIWLNRNSLTNQSKEPTAFGAFSSAVALRVRHRRWITFLR